VLVWFWLVLISLFWVSFYSVGLVCVSLGSSSSLGPVSMCPGCISAVGLLCTSLGWVGLGCVRLG
jgi:hypothetical protein